MGRDFHSILSSGAGPKCAAVFQAISDGHREIAAIAEAVRLPRSTVIRVAALLLDLGRIRVRNREAFELEVIAPE
jgi:DNA-binding IclR family transcriptional regulator